MTGRVVDMHAVCCVCLAELLAPIIKQEQARNGRDEHGQQRMRTQTSGALDTLQRESGIHQRRIYGVLTHEYATVGLSTADALLCAFDRPDLVHALEIFERPRATRMGEPGEHVCSLSSAGRLAAVEPSLRTTAPVAEGLLTTQSRREAA